MGRPHHDSLPSARALSCRHGAVTGLFKNASFGRYSVGRRDSNCTVYRQTPATETLPRARMCLATIEEVHGLYRVRELGEHTDSRNRKPIDRYAALHEGDGTQRVVGQRQSGEAPLQDTIIEREHEPPSSRVGRRIRVGLKLLVQIIQDGISRCADERVVQYPISRPEKGRW